jgi:hypothetical protein
MIEENKTQPTLRGPSYGFTDILPKREMWKKIAEELNGDFKILYDAGHTIEIHHIEIPYKKWKIEISESDTRPLKIKVSFDAGQPFNLVLSRTDSIENLLNKFSRSSVKIGWKAFDSRYLIKSNRSDVVKQSITSDIQKTILRFCIYSLSFQTDTKTGKAELIGVFQRSACYRKMVFKLTDMFKLLIDNFEKLKIIR